MSASDMTLNAEDRIDIADAMYHLGAGIDENSAEHLARAVTIDAVVDFGPASRALGNDFPVMTGRSEIISKLTATVGLLDTTHVITNPRVEVTGDLVVFKAYVEATHFPPGDHSRRCVMMNRHVTIARKEDGVWKLAKVDVTCAWFDGDPAVMLGK